MSYSEEEVRPSHLDTTQAMRTLGGRGLNDYEEFLGFDRSNLEGKTVLDLGSGAWEKLTSELKKTGVKAKVVSLNPDYVLGKYRNIIGNQKSWQKESVAGVGQALPFSDESFDVILALESITYYEDALHESASAQIWPKEIARVLKKGGEARLGEILGLAGEKKKEAWDKVITILKSLGLEARMEPFKLKGEPHLRHRLYVYKPL